MIKKAWNYFSAGEKILWGVSVFIILVSFFAFDGKGYLTLSASVIGVTSLIFNAKGNLAGQALMIVFSIIYGIISFGFAYYGEMITYVGMTMPMAIASFITWFSNPYEKNETEVKVNSLCKKEVVFMMFLTLIVTGVFYFILDFFNTANIVPSTISVFTSFAAVYLTFRRSAYFTLAYAANDIVLIVLWVMASAENLSYISVTICFAVFLVNDIYGFISWSKMKLRQQADRNAA